jgi:TRAP-type C4-dicarboxylate transport system substrate-binding protein
MPSPLPQYNIVGVGDAPATLADFEGMSVRATGGIGAAMETVGAVPTSMSATEVRQAMDSGVVKAVSFAPHAHMSFGTVENAEWWTTNLNPGTVNCPVVANSDALADLSDAHREALTSSIDEALNYYIESYNTKTMDAWGPLLEEKGITQVTFTDGEIAAFKEAAAAPAANAWIEANTAAGLPAQELYDLVTGMVAEGM